MHRLREELLQFAWAHRLLGRRDLSSVAGRRIVVHSPGTLNVNAGPDFSNARIEVDGVTLAGNVEIHVRTSDWLRHGHQDDASYDNIILHVVYEHDAKIPQNDINQVEVLELKDLVDKRLFQTHASLFTSRAMLPCGHLIADVADEVFDMWVRRMAVERLESKVRYAAEIFEACSRDYSETFYTMLLRSFGVPVNGLPFEMLSRAVPLRLLLKHANDIMQVEALLIGGASLLHEGETQRCDRLSREFGFLSKKYGIAPLPEGVVKHSRMHHAASPARRLAQFAALVHRGHILIQHPEAIRSVEDAKYLLRGHAGRKPVPGGRNAAAPGDRFTETVLINAFAPFFVFYGRKTGQPFFSDAGVQLTESCAPEENFKTKLFVSKKKRITDAAMSQGLIRLHDEYCVRKRCLSCGIGAALLCKSNKDLPKIAVTASPS
jgi:hypothetical protein